MLMNKKSDYALRIIRSLQDGKMRIAPTLAKEEQIPLAFVYKILKQLSKAGIVGLERGPKGGCCLLVNLNEVSLYDLIIAMEENVHVTGCMRSDYDCEWQRVHGLCRIHGNLRAIQREIENKLRSISLMSIINDIYTGECNDKED